MTVIFAYLDEPPFCAPGAGGAGGKPTGFEVLFAVLQSIGIDAIETQLTTFAELLPGVASGRWHINTPLFVTAERRQLVDFSRPVWSLSDGLMLRAGDERRLNSYDALAADAGARLVTVTRQRASNASRPRPRPCRICSITAPTPMPAWRWPIAVF
jgi:polar amino acid transport system substrate-binding protein